MVGTKQHQKAIKELKKCLMDTIESAKKYNEKSEKRKLQTITHTKGNIPTFSKNKDDELKTEMMVGALEVTLISGEQIKLLAVSGDNQIYDRTNQLFTFNSTNNFKFINNGTPKDTKIVDLFLPKEENLSQKWNKSCAAQKLFAHLGTLIRGKGSKIKSLSLYETYFSYGSPDNRRQSYITAVNSCAYCEKVLPYATGGPKPQKGLQNIIYYNISSISPSFYEYTMEGISHILRLRACCQKLKNVIILPEQYIFSPEQNNIIDIFSSIKLIMNNIHNNSEAILAPISLYNKHAVGIMFVSQETKSSQNLDTMTAFYIDPSNEPIPEGLKTIFNFNGYTLEQLPAEHQRYTNCGPEVIENFMLYLTGKRLSQEDAIIYNSRLVEQGLMSDTNSSDSKHFSKALSGSYFMHTLAKKCVSEYELIPEVEDAQDNPVIELQQEENARVIDNAFEQSIEILASEQEITTNSDELVTTSHNDGNRLYLRATELAEKGWIVEGSEDENDALIAASSFTEAMQLYAEAINLDPTNIMYRQGFNIISLKIDGNSLFNEGVELTDLAYQLEEELLSGDTGDIQNYDIIINKYQDVIRVYQAAHGKFTEGLMLSRDMCFESCMELVEHSINSIQEAVEQLESEKLGIKTLIEVSENTDAAEDSELTSKKQVVSINEPFIALFAESDGQWISESALMGNTQLVEYHLSM
jgi:tetratricopeptide (TPR) repeat protein